MHDASSTWISCWAGASGRAATGRTARLPCVGSARALLLVPKEGRRPQCSRRATSVTLWTLVSDCRVQSRDSWGCTTLVPAASIHPRDFAKVSSLCPFWRAMSSLCFLAFLHPLLLACQLCSAAGLSTTLCSMQQHSVHATHSHSLTPLSCFGLEHFRRRHVL